MTETDDQLSVALRLVWTDGEQVPVMAANQFLVQVYEGDVVLSVGMLVPPVLLRGASEEEIERISAAGYVPIRTVARLAMSRRRLDELVKLLQQGVEMYDKQQEENEGGLQ